MAGSNYCWIHSPNISRFEKKLASSKGGTNRHLSEMDFPEIIIKSSKDIPPLLVDTIQRLRNRTIDVRRGTAIGYLSDMLLRSYEIADIESRIERLEEMIKTGEFEIREEQDET